MNDLDEAIRKSLANEDARILDRLAGDQALHEQVLAMFQGRLRWLSALGWLVGFALFGVACFAAWRFADAAHVRGMLIWFSVGALAVSGLALVKVWFWLELARNSIVREVKRVELEVAQVAARLPKQ